MRVSARHREHVFILGSRVLRHSYCTWWTQANGFFPGAASDLLLPAAELSKALRAAWMERIGGYWRRTCGFFRSCRAGMIGLAGFDRSLTRYRNNSTDIAGTVCSRLIRGQKMRRIFLFFEVAGCDIDDRFLGVSLSSIFKPTPKRFCRLH